MHPTIRSSDFSASFVSSSSLLAYYRLIGACFLSHSLSFIAFGNRHNLLPSLGGIRHQKTSLWNRVLEDARLQNAPAAIMPASGRPIIEEHRNSMVLGLAFGISFTINDEIREPPPRCQRSKSKDLAMLSAAASDYCYLGSLTTSTPTHTRRT